MEIGIQKDLMNTKFPCILIVFALPSYEHTHSTLSTVMAPTLKAVRVTSCFYYVNIHTPQNPYVISGTRI